MNRLLPRVIAIVLGLFAVAWVDADSYYTTPILEPDRICSAWIMKRFVDTTAIFVFAPRDSVVPNATAFDIPSARYRRYPRYSCATSIARINNVQDKRAKTVLKLVDEIELQTWDTHMSKPAKALEDRLMSYVESKRGLHEILDMSFVLLDSLAGLSNTKQEK